MCHKTYKSQNLDFFSKKGFKGVKKLKKLFHNQKGLQKLHTEHVPHAPKKDFQKKLKFGVFQKRGLGDVKK